MKRLKLLFDVVLNSLTVLNGDVGRVCDLCCSMVRCVNCV